MKQALILLFILSTFTQKTLGSNDSCEINFQKLEQISQLERIDNEQVKSAYLLSVNMNKIGCFDMVLNTDSGEKWTSLTLAFWDICKKADRESSVLYFTKYMVLTTGSAEELRGDVYEELFKKHPLEVLAECNMNRDLLDLIAWGFCGKYYDDFENSTIKKG